MLFRRSTSLSEDQYAEGIAKGLRKAFENATESATIDVGALKVVVFSDLHRGSGDRADDFRRAHRAYRAALGWYLQHGYELWLLGTSRSCGRTGARRSWRPTARCWRSSGASLLPTGRGCAASTATTTSTGASAGT
jgi:hypothetical protein